MHRLQHMVQPDDAFRIVKPERAAFAPLIPVTVEIAYAAVVSTRINLPEACRERFGHRKSLGLRVRLRGPVDDKHFKRTTAVINLGLEHVSTLTAVASGDDH